MSATPEVQRILCAGDRFIEASVLARAALARFGGAQLVEHSSGWPDEPFGPVAGVREASGDPAQLASLAGGVDLILTHMAPITDEVFSAAGPRLRAVRVTRGGPVNVDLAAAWGKPPRCRSAGTSRRARVPVPGRRPAGSAHRGRHR